MKGLVFRDITPAPRETTGTHALHSQTDADREQIARCLECTQPRCTLATNNTVDCYSGLEVSRDRKARPAPKGFTYYETGCGKWRCYYTIGGYGRTTISKRFNSRADARAAVDAAIKELDK